MSSVEPRNPPEPDIACRYLNGSNITFEMVEFLDPNFKRTYEIQQSKVKAMYAYLDSMSRSEREAFESQYRNALILVNFHEHLTLTKIKAILPRVFEELAGLSYTFDDLINSFSTDGLKDSVQSISVARNEINGPLFDGLSIARVGDPCVGTVQNKLAKSYRSAHPIELIAYINENPMFPESVWKPTLDTFLNKLPSLAPFRKIWVLDLGNHSIVYMKPG
ncbi:hypothetical protein YTPLAS72_13880 [Nitrospira sp.]|nr:hypothetical protein YTPLAS72_13880 [Nitrospira sp.]